MTSADDWDAVLRPRRVPRYAYFTAAIISVAAIVVGFLFNIKSTGAFFRPADQISVAALGLIIAGAILLLARPRLRIGPGGMVVRNLLVDRTIPWSEVVDLSFPAGARWARVDLPHYEYVPVLAIQSFDGVLAVESMDTARELVAKYRAESASSDRRP